MVAEPQPTPAASIEETTIDKDSVVGNRIVISSVLADGSAEAVPPSLEGAAEAVKREWSGGPVTAGWRTVIGGPRRAYLEGLEGCAHVSHRGILLCALVRAYTSS